MPQQNNVQLLLNEGVIVGPLTPQEEAAINDLAPEEVETLVRIGTTIKERVSLAPAAPFRPWFI